MGDKSIIVIDNFCDKSPLVVLLAQRFHGSRGLSDDELVSERSTQHVEFYSTSDGDLVSGENA